jgi:hypothetical protein
VLGAAGCVACQEVQVVMRLSRCTARVVGVCCSRNLCLLLPHAAVVMLAALYVAPYTFDTSRSQQLAIQESLNTVCMCQHTCCAFGCRACTCLTRLRLQL